MSRLFNCLFKKYVTEAYKKGYSFGLTVGLDLGKTLASDQPAVIGIESKIQREIDEIIKSKRF